MDVTQRARLGISFAFQQPVRFKGITVRQLLETAAGGSLEEKRLCDLLGSVGLCAKNYLDREVNATLSGGEMKRIEIATILARRTCLAVFDEPEAGIDLWSFKSLIDVFWQMRRGSEEKRWSSFPTRSGFCGLPMRLCFWPTGRCRPRGREMK